TGRVQFFSPGGENQAVALDGTNLSATAYAIPPRGSQKLRAGGGNSTLVGSFVVTPDREQMAPSVATVYAYAAGGVTVSATGSAAIQTGQQFDVYTEVAGPLGAIGSIQTGVAIANPAREPVEVDFQLFRLDGSFSGIAGKLTIPPNGQKVSF